MFVSRLHHSLGWGWGEGGLENCPKVVSILVSIFPFQSIIHDQAGESKETMTNQGKLPDILTNSHY